MNKLTGFLVLPPPGVCLAVTRQSRRPTLGFRRVARTTKRKIGFQIDAAAARNHAVDRVIARFDVQQDRRVVVVTLQLVDQLLFCNCVDIIFHIPLIAERRLDSKWRGWESALFTIFNLKTIEEFLL